VAEFVSDICGKKNSYSGEAFEREKPGCSSCGSTLRTRALMGALSMELFGIRLSLADFPDVSGEDMRGRFCFIVPQKAWCAGVEILSGNSGRTILRKPKDPRPFAVP
jgi:hypothetical protein